jgi:hypothetical protein
VSTTTSAPSAAGVRGPTGAAWLTSALLLVSGAGVGLAAIMGVATPNVPSTLGAATAAAWVALLPGIAAVLVTAVARTPGLALTAGAGLAGIARLVADLFVVLQPESVARPELLYPLSATAFPVRVAGGAAVLLVADVVAVLAGVLAARALAGRVRELRDSGLTEQIASAGRSDGADDPFVDDPFGGPGAGGVRAGAFGAGGFGADGTDGGGFADDGLGDGPAPVVRNVPMLAVGFLAIAVFGFSGIQATYTGGYIEKMLFIPGSDAGTVIAPFLLAFLALGAVTFAGSLPRSTAMALLGGVAAAVATPAITAMVVAAGDAPVQLSSAAFGVLAGALVLLLAGLLTRVRWRSAGSAEVPATGAAEPAVTVESPSTATVPESADEVARSTGIRWVATGLALLAGVLLCAAWRLDLLSGSGPVQTVAEQGGLANGRTAVSFLLAGVVLVVAGLASAAGRRPAGLAGRAALTVTWGAAVWAIARPISVLAEYRSGTEQAQLALSGGALTPAERAQVDATVAHWSIGPGLWCGMIAALLALAAAVLAGVALAREQDELTTVRDDDDAEVSARLRRRTGLGLAVAAVVALALPLSSVDGVISAALFSLGADVSWAGWAVLVAVLLAVAVGMTTGSGWIALGALVAAAAVLVVYAWPPAGVSSDPGYAVGPGTVAAWVLVVLLLAGAVVMWWSAHGVTASEVTTSELTSPAPAGAAQAVKAGSSAPNLSAPKAPAQKTASSSRKAPASKGARRGTAGRKRPPKRR